MKRAGTCLTVTIVCDARRRVARGETVSAVAKTHGVNYSTLYLACIGRTWGWIQDPEPVPAGGAGFVRLRTSGGTCVVCGHRTAVARQRCRTCVSYQQRRGVDRPRGAIRLRTGGQPVLYGDRQQEACRLYRNGQSLAAIATSLGVSKSVVRSALRRGHVSPRLVGRRSKLTPAMVLQARLLAAEQGEWTFKRLAARYNVSYDVMYNALHGVTFAAVGGPLQQVQARQPVAGEEPPCVLCGMREGVQAGLCRYCRQEGRVVAHCQQCGGVCAAHKSRLCGPCRQPCAD